MTEFINKDSGLPLGYFELLKMIDGDLIFPTEEGLEHLYKPWPRRRYWIRHDVDEHIERAWEMAKAEHERGIRTAYFFLHTAQYWKWQAFISMAADFAGLGHTIGIHNNAVTVAMREGDQYQAEDVLKHALGRLRKAGEVWITASHGDAWNRQNGMLNYEMFTECRRKKCPFRHHPLAHYGLRYEAYFTPKDFYLSDSGSKWRSDPYETADQFNQSESAIMQILVHPQWWSKRD